MLERRYKLRRGKDPNATALLRRLKSAGYPQLKGVRIEYVLSIEIENKYFPQSDPAEELMPLFANDLIEVVLKESALRSKSGPILEVGYQRAVTDPELDSVFHAAEALGIPGLVCVKFSRRYQLRGVSKAVAREIVQRFICNQEVEVILDPNHPWQSLLPQGKASGMDRYDVAAMIPDEFRLTLEERRLFPSPEQRDKIQQIFRQLGRPATDGELEMLVARWSDHCFHGTWKALGLMNVLRDAIKQVGHPLVISALHDNSGVMRFYDDWALNLKGETHISPFFVSPYGAIMTLHGGVLRDIILTGQGAFPLLSTLLIGTTDPRTSVEDVPPGAPHPRQLVVESIRGTRDYCNPMGVPNAWSEWLKHPRGVKPFALGHSVGLLPEARAHKGKPRPGDFVVYIGGQRGRDGLHGATVSSGASTSQTATLDAAHVQIGLPIEERKFTEAVPVLRDADCIRACTDCGAAGLCSAVGEMGEGCGVWANLAWVPLKYAQLQLWEIWLSESQEGGVLCIPPEKLDDAKQILHDYDVPFAVLGLFTNTGACHVIHDPSIESETWQKRLGCGLTGEVLINLPYSLLNDCPLPHIEVREPQVVSVAVSLPSPKNEADWRELVARHLGHYNLADQSGAIHQFDQTVQGRTAIPAIGGKTERMRDDLFVCAPLRGNPYAAGVAVAASQFYPAVNPAGAGQLLMAQALAKLVAAGLNPDEVVANVNVYTPTVTDNPENAWRLVQLVKSGYLPASVALGMPVISGKDSSSGTYLHKASGLRIDAPLTLVVLALGRHPDASRLIPKPFQRPGNLLYFYTPGLIKPSLGGSTFLDGLGQQGNELTELDLAEVRRGLRSYHKLVANNQVAARGVVAGGGLITTLYHMSLGSGLGCTANLEADPLVGLFAEYNVGIVFETGIADAALLEEQLEGSLAYIGLVTDEPRLSVTHCNNPLFTITTEELGRLWFLRFKEVAA